MNTILYDDFAGTASISGTTPEIPPQPGLQWAVTSGLDPLTVVNSAGWVKYTSANANAFANAQLTIGDDVTPRGLGVACVLSLQFKAHSTATTDMTWYNWVMYAGESALALVYQVAGVWYIRTGATIVTIGSSPLTPGQIYPAQLVVYPDGTSTFTALGKSAVNNTPLSQASLNSGITGMRFNIPKVGEWKLLSVATDVFNEGALISPPGSLTATGTAYATTTFNADIKSPPSVIRAFSGVNALLATSPPALFSSGRSSAGENDFTYTAPSAHLSAHGGANARLDAPSPVLNVAAAFVGWGNADIAAPSATLSASGAVSGVGQAALTVYDPHKLIGYSGAVASITLTGKYTVQAQSTAGSIGGAAITCPLFELSASGTAQNYGSANLLAPAARLGAQAQAWLVAPGFTLTAIGSATITATYEAYAVNLLHRNTDAPVNETTRYTNFPFTHVVRYQNSYYGANSTGLYLLEGATDDGAAIPWEFKTTITDFESPMAKTAVSVYFAGRMGPAATVGIHLGESGDVSYSHSTPRGPAAQNYRQVFGLGLKSRYYALSVAGEGVMELDSVEFNTKTLTRRI